MQTTSRSRAPDAVTSTEAPQRRHQIAVEDLCCGMFVAELDRPWLDTPFLLQGFIIDSDVELETIRRHCRFALVDPARSLPSVLLRIRAADVLNRPSRTGAVEDGAAGADGSRFVGRDESRDEVGDGGVNEAGNEADDAGALARDTEPRALAAHTDTLQPLVDATSITRPRRAYRVRADVRVDQNTRERFRRFVRETATARGLEADTGLERVLAWLRRSMPGSVRGRGIGGNTQQRGELLPAGVTPTGYGDLRPMQQELARAARAFDEGERLLLEISEQVRHGAAPDLTRLDPVVDAVATSIADNPDALMWVTGLRDEEPNVHRLGVKVAVCLTAFGRHLGFPPEGLQRLASIGLLADVGKARLPRALLDKPGMLNPGEFGIVKEHVRIGLRLLRKSVALPTEVEAGIAHHHERLDGSGYPRGRRGEQISVYGRMAAIADCFAALTTPRTYANPLAPQDALMNLYQWGGRSFHAPLIEEFVQAIGAFPVGSLVEQSSGEVGAVLAHNRVRLLQPQVLVLTAVDKTPLTRGFVRDLAEQPRDDRNRVIRIVRSLPSRALGLRLADYPLQAADTTALVD